MTLTTPREALIGACQLRHIVVTFIPLGSQIRQDCFVGVNFLRFRRHLLIPPWTYAIQGAVTQPCWLVTASLSHLETSGAKALSS